ncbi:MAG: hypothetical protein K8H99_11565 [Nitrospirae bacterium]|nr:hypothetical protein [Fimbriimonadaceae bacterium]
MLFGTIPLPLDLTLLGMPGCAWYTDIAATLPMATSSGTARVTFVLPNTPNVVGLQFFCQGLVFDPAANSAGLISTNAGAGIIGAK